MTQMLLIIKQKKKKKNRNRLTDLSTNMVTKEERWKGSGKLGGCN